MDFAIASNIDEVIAEVEDFAKKAPFTGRVFTRKQWKVRIREVAQRALYEVAAGPEEESLVPRFVNTATSIVFGEERMVWSMDDGRPGMIGVGEAVEKSHEGPLFFHSAKADRQQVWELIKDWVKAGREGKPGGKRIESGPGGRDEGLNDGQIATNLFMILFGPTKGEVAEAREGLVRALTTFAQVRVDAKKAVLSDEKVDEWFEAVRRAWVELFDREVVGAIVKEIEREWGRRI